MNSEEVGGGPSFTTLIDYGGDGDCGWKVLAFSITRANSKGQIDSAAIRVKTEVIGRSVRVQIVNHLLHSDITWSEAWAPDPNANVVTEDGKVTKTVEEFKEALTRPKRWVCGLTMQAVAMIKNVTITIFQWEEKGDGEGKWERTALIAPSGDPKKLKNLKNIALVTLDGGGKKFPATWSSPLKCGIINDGIGGDFIAETQSKGLF